MKINKGPPTRGKGYVFYRKYTNRHDGVNMARKFEKEGRKPYIRKIGKIGAKYPYELWILPKFKIF